MIWTRGVGDYGDGWGYSGTGVTVQQGGTVYIKYWSDENDVVLTFADHGRDWKGAWHRIGPSLTDGIGAHGGDPVILKISNVGTPKSTVAWINGSGTSGIWSGLPAPGPYDLALHADARWTLPPIVVTEKPKPPSFWSTLFAGPPEPAPTPGGGTFSVPDSGSTGLLLGTALLVLALFRRAPR